MGRTGTPQKPASRKHRDGTSTERLNVTAPPPEAAPPPPEAPRLQSILPWAVAASLMALVAWLYARTTNFPLVFDDLIYLRDNPLLTDSRSFGFLVHFVEFANRPLTLGLDPDLAANFILRPVAYLSFHINYIFGGFQPGGYRLVNIAIHSVNTALIWLLVRQLLSHGIHAAQLRKSSVNFIAAASALWFATHPLATESVTFIVQRFTSLVTLFYLLTLVLYMTAQSQQDRALRRLLVAGASVTLVLGMLTKECGFTAPVMAVLLDWLVRGTRLRRALTKALPLLIWLPLIPTLVFLVSWAQNGSSMHLANAINLANSKDAPYRVFDYAVTQLTVVVGYLRLLVWPSGLNIDHDWPLHQSLLALPVLGSITLILGLVAGTGWLMRRRRNDTRLSLMFVSVLWFLITISISSGIVPLPDLMAEHRCYLPSIGFFIGVACLFDWIRTGPFFKSAALAAAPAAAAAATIALCMVTVQRNQVWSSRISLWEDACSKSPHKYRVWGNLGSSYAEAGRYEDSERCYYKAKEADPQFLRAYIHLGTLALAQDHCRQAIDISQEAVRVIPVAEQSAEIRYNIGIALLGLGRADEGARYLKDILAHIPNHRDSHYALGKYYWNKKRYMQALNHWRRAAMLNAKNEDLPHLITLAEAKIQQ